MTDPSQSVTNVLISWRIVTDPSQSWTNFRIVTEIPSQISRSSHALYFRHKYDLSVTISVTNCDGYKFPHNFPSQFNFFFVVRVTQILWASRFLRVSQVVSMAFTIRCLSCLLFLSSTVDGVKVILEDEIMSSTNGGFYQFLVRWKGRPQFDNSWVREDDLRRLPLTWWKDIFKPSSRGERFQAGEKSWNHQEILGSIRIIISKFN